MRFEQLITGMLEQKIKANIDFFIAPSTGFDI